MTRLALVQGASRGLGLAFVRALLGRVDVDRVIATCRTPEASEGLARLRSERTGPVLAEMEEAGEIKIAGALYDMDTGVIDFLD